MTFVAVSSIHDWEKEEFMSFNRREMKKGKTAEAHLIMFSILCRNENETSTDRHFDPRAV
jgi:hypothetical protein